MRPAVLLLFLIGCSGSGATVADSSADLREERTRAVEVDDPVDPVDPTTAFECKTSSPLSDGSTPTIRFSVRGDELEEQVTVEPASSPLAPLAGAALERRNGKLLLVTADHIELGLFENSELTRGYAKAAGDYSDVYCTKR